MNRYIILTLIGSILFSGSMHAARVRVVNDSWKFVKVSYDNMEDHTLRHDMQHPFIESSMVVIKMPVEC